ncbi:hypothetical protein GW17_00045022 [Ensete ventricosum]|nr:hypothetical protein GW17_00045022 [Ensete ventricosum]
MTSSDSSSNASVVPSAGSGGTSLVEPEASFSGVSSGPSSSVDARVLRDLEVMKVGHDLDTTVIEGSLVAIKERYNIPVEYGLHVLLPGQRPYSSDAPKGRDADLMDLSDLREMSKVPSWKPPATRNVVLAREVSGTPSNKALRSSSKRPFDGSAPQSGDPTRKYKKVKVLSRRHKSHRDEGGSRSHSKGKEPMRSVEELEAPEESAEEIVAPIFRRLKSMKDLCETLIRKDDEGYYTLYMSDMALQDMDKELRARWEPLMNLTKI